MADRNRVRVVDHQAAWNVQYHPVIPSSTGQVNDWHGGFGLWCFFRCLDAELGPSINGTCVFFGRWKKSENAANRFGVSEFRISTWCYFDDFLKILGASGIQGKFFSHFFLQGFCLVTRGFFSELFWNHILSSTVAFLQVLVIAFPRSSKTCFLRPNRWSWGRQLTNRNA